MLSTIQLKKSIHKWEETYLVELVEINKGQSMEVPKLVAKILREFREVMPS